MDVADLPPGLLGLSSRTTTRFTGIHSKFQGDRLERSRRSGVKRWIKATEGGDRADARFQANWTGAKAARCTRRLSFRLSVPARQWRRGLRPAERAGRLPRPAAGERVQATPTSPRVRSYFRKRHRPHEGDAGGNGRQAAYLIRRSTFMAAILSDGAFSDYPDLVDPPSTILWSSTDSRAWACPAISPMDRRPALTATASTSSTAPRRSSGRPFSKSRIEARRRRHPRVNARETASPVHPAVDASFAVDAANGRIALDRGASRARPKRLAAAVACSYQPAGRRRANRKCGGLVLGAVPCAAFLRRHTGETQCPGRRGRSQDRSARLSPRAAAGKARDPGDQAARQPARPGARLFAGRRRALPRDPRRSRRRPPTTRRAQISSRVISNGTAVLGLGNIGPLAAKPVMEGKAVLFKKFAGIDVFDIEIDETDDRPAWSTSSRAGADLRRHQPRGHQGARMLRGRGAAAAPDEHPGLPRRPARHGDHRRRRRAQRASNFAGKKIERRQDRRLRRRRGRARLPQPPRLPRREAREHLGHATSRASSTRAATS